MKSTQDWIVISSNVGFSEEKEEEEDPQAKHTALKDILTFIIFTLK